MKYVCLVLAALLALSIAYPRQKGDEGAALRAERHTRDSILARNAEREVRYMADADSLRGVIRKFGSLSQRVITRADTVLVPVPTWKYVVDTLTPKCEACAARQDTIAEDRKAERASWWKVEQRYIDDNARLRKKLDRQSFTSRLGVSCGYGVVKVGPDVKAGPGCMASIRVFP